MSYPLDRFLRLMKGEHIQTVYFLLHDSFPHLTIGVQHCVYKPRWFGLRTVIKIDTFAIKTYDDHVWKWLPVNAKTFDIILYASADDSTKFSGDANFYDDCPTYSRFPLFIHLKPADEPDSGPFSLPECHLSASAT